MDGFLGEIRLFAFPKAPDGWLLCQGQILQIQKYTSLFSLLSNRYGGDAKTTFALPDLRGRVPVSIANGLSLGNSGGVDSVTLTMTQMPAHTHSVAATTSVGTVGIPTGLYPAQATKPSGSAATVPAAPPFYGAANSLTSLAPKSVGESGGNKGHDNRQPYLAINYCICVTGYYPPRN